MLPPGILRTTMGLYVLEHDTHLSRWVENCGRLDIPYNVEQVRNLAHLVPAGGVVVNAGASLGDHALIYSQLVGSDGMVYAFEPHPLTAQALTLNMARLANVAVSSLGLSDVPRHARFACDPNIGASSVDPQGDVSVDLVTLDGWLLPILYRDRQRCDLIHLDAEGSEPQILRGARALLAEYRPAIVLEVCAVHLRRAGSSQAALLELLTELGYSIRPIPDYDHPDQWDGLALPTTGNARRMSRTP